MIVPHIHSSVRSLEEVAAPRLMNADILKAIAIIAVVFIHGALIVPAPITFINWIFLAFRFCVPVFIFMWAFFTEKSLLKREDELSYLFIRFRRLVLPFLFWSSIYFLIIADFGKLTFVKFVTRHWTGSGWSGQYYFIILFQLIITFTFSRYISRIIYKHNFLIILFSIVFYTFVSYSSLFDIDIISKVGARLFLYWLPYVLIGAIYARVGFSKKNVLPIYFVFIAPFLIPLEVYFFHPTIISHTPYLLPSTFVSSLIVIYSLMGKNITSVSTPSWLNKIIEIISRNTLGIFCLNPLIVLLLSYLLQTFKLGFDFWGHYIVTPIVSTLIVLAICIGLINFLKKINLGVLVSS